MRVWPKSSANSSLLEDIKILTANFYQSIQFLSSHYLTSRSQLPWYLIIGPKSSGKTTLMNHAELNFVATDRLVQQFNADVPFHRCNWWLIQNAVFIDVPGHFLTEHETEKAYLWRTTLKLLKKKRKHLDGIICVLNLHT